jgi:hypothetical protein
MLLGRIIAMGVLISIAGLVFSLFVTRPSDVGASGILLVFVLMYISILGMLTLLIFCVGKTVVKISTMFVVVSRPITPMTLRRSYYYSSVVALAPVMLIGMQSVGEVGFYDLILIFIFVVVACIYVSKRIS